MSLLQRFRFQDPGPLTDGELELVSPAERWIDPLLETLRDPRTRDLSPSDSALSREQLMRFVREFPLGRQTGEVPAYHFWMRLRPGFGAPAAAEVEIAGGIGLRAASTENVTRYIGHVGYNVYPPARGHGYAARAVRLLLPFARRLGLTPLWITCNPENVASRRTCERAGGTLVETVKLPPDHPLYQKGERAKCRYRFGEQ